MKQFYIEPTDDSPEISADIDKMEFKITGISTPENAVEFYKPVIKWINENKNNFHKPLNCSFYFTYLSSSSHKVIFDILSVLEEIFKENQKINIEWIYKEIDEDMLDVGHDFEDLLNLPFTFKPI